MSVWKFVWIYLVIVNVLAFCMYGIDKRKAEHHQWRIPESTLILLAAIGGGLGSYSAMHAFHHKTQHKKFTILVPFFLIFWIMALVYLYMKVR